MALVTGPDSPQNVQAKKVADAITKDSKGRIQAKVFDSGQLGQTTGLLDAIKTNAGVQATITVIASDVCPQTGLFLQPYVFTDRAHAYSALDGPTAKKIFQECQPNGFRIPAAWDSGFRQVTTSKRPINSVADLKGLKIRVPPGALWVDTFKGFGANPTPMAVGALYSALQQEVGDGREQPIPNIYAGELMDVQKYLAITNHMYGPAFVIVSQAWWAGLPPELQRIVDHDIQAGTRPERALSEQLETSELKEFTDKYQMTVTHPDLAAFAAATATVRRDQGAKFPPDLMAGILKDAGP